MNKPTKTINRLHFSDLDPLRFEDLCFEIMSKEDKFSDLKNYGRKGNDDGVDISANIIINCNKKLLNVQCKRYKKITTNELRNIVDKISSQPILPYKILLIISCDVSKTMYQNFENYSKEKGIIETEIWTASNLEAKLYKDNKDLLLKYFGINLEKTTLGEF